MEACSSCSISRGWGCVCAPGRWARQGGAPGAVVTAKNGLRTDGLSPEGLAHRHLTPNASFPRPHSTDAAFADIVDSALSRTPAVIVMSVGKSASRRRNKPLTAKRRGARRDGLIR